MIIDRMLCRTYARGVATIEATEAAASYKILEVTYIPILKNYMYSLVYVDG